MSDTLTDLDRLIVTDEVRQLMAQYVYHADHKEFDKLARLFAPTATFSIYDAKGALVLEMTGPRQIEEIITSSVGASSAVHHLFSFVTDVHSPTSASSVINMEDMIDPPEGEAPDAPLEEGRPFRSMHGYGHYRGEFAKADGVWRIQKFAQTRIKVDVTM
ncbi:nuclear transport factor 2 family protein [Streptomyces sp. NPDC026672]|uniref:nuclear transport factor 2 family protein n=1 Tax=unclassified Streptomyces TaxID=2593676 RepID=UPI0033E1E255